MQAYVFKWLQVSVDLKGYFCVITQVVFMASTMAYSFGLFASHLWNSIYQFYICICLKPLFLVVYCHTPSELTEK